MSQKIYLNQKSNTKGFTLTEILIASVMLLILCATVLQMFSQAVNRAKHSKEKIKFHLKLQEIGSSSENQPTLPAKTVCQPDWQEYSQGTTLHLSCKGTVKKIRLQKTWSNQLVQWELP